MVMFYRRKFQDKATMKPASIKLLSICAKVFSQKKNYHSLQHAPPSLLYKLLCTQSFSK